jgi:hypothetical protein
MTRTLIIPPHEDTLEDLVRNLYSHADDLDHGEETRELADYTRNIAGRIERVMRLEQGTRSQE